MNLYLLRHGDAQATAASDEARELTERGRAETRKVAQWFKRLNPKIEVAISSPLIRACQTADIVAQELSLSSCLQKSESLSPEKSPEGILSILNELPHNEVLLVGHLPFLGYLLSAFVWGDLKVEVPFKKSGLAFVQLPEIRFGSGSLQWMVRPDIL